MKSDIILNDLKKKIYQPIYFLYGKEAYYIDQISDYIAENTLRVDEQSFNQFIFYGKDSDLIQIIGQAKKFPMMANQQVIIVREAQGLKGLTSASTKNKPNPLHLYCQNPVPSTILVFCYKTPADSSDKLSASFLNGLGKKSIIFESKALYDNELPAWIHEYTSSKNYKISAEATALLIESIGGSLTTLAREINKLAIALPINNNNIDASLVEKNIGISREYSIFELSNILANGNASQIFKISHNLANKQSDKVIYFIDRIYDFFLKTFKYSISENKSNDIAFATELGVNRFFIKNYASASKRFNGNKIISIFGLLREYDLKCKGVGASDDKGELFKELVAKIIYQNQ